MSNKNLFKKILSVYLAILMVVTMLPLSSFANEERNREKITVNLTVNGPTHRGQLVGTQFASEELIEVNADDTVKDVILKYVEKYDVPYIMQDTQYGAYLSSLHNLKEKDYDGTSGWTYLVWNENKNKYEAPDVGVGAYKITKPEKIKLVYTIENYLSGYQSENKKAKDMKKAIVEKIDKSKMTGKIAAMLYNTGENIPETYAEVVRGRVSNLSASSSVEDYWDTILGVLAVRKNPYNAWGRNLVQEIGQRDLLNSSIDDMIYGIAIANSAQFEMMGAMWNAKSLQDKLKTLQNTDGSFGEGSDAEKIIRTARVYNLADFSLTLNPIANKMEDYLASNMHLAGGFPIDKEDGLVTAEVALAMSNRSKDANGRISYRVAGNWNAATKASPFKSLIDFYIDSKAVFRKDLLIMTPDEKTTEVATLAIARINEYFNNPRFGGESLFKFPKVNMPSDEENVNQSIDAIYENLVSKLKTKSDISEIEAYILRRMGEELSFEQKSKLENDIKLNPKTVFAMFKSGLASTVNSDTAKANLEKILSNSENLSETMFNSSTNSAYGIILSLGSKVKLSEARENYLKSKLLNYGGFQQDRTISKSDTHIYYAGAVSLINDENAKNNYIKNIENFLKKNNSDDIKLQTADIVAALNILGEDFTNEKYKTKDDVNLLKMLKEQTTSLDKVLFAVSSYKLQKSDNSNIFDFKLKQSKEETVNEIINKYLESSNLKAYILSKYDNRDISDKVEESKYSISNKNYNVNATSDKTNIFNLLAGNVDITDLDGNNLIDNITKKAQSNRKILNIDSLTILESSNFKTDPSHPENRETLKNKVVAMKEFKDDATGKYLISDAGKAFIALSSYYKSGDEQVVTAVNKLLEKASASMQNDGTITEFGNNMPLSLPYHSDDLASFIQGLIYLGIDPDKDSRFIKNGKSLIDGLLSYEVEGGFPMKRGDNANASYTGKVLEALIDYKLFKEEKALIYQYNIQTSSPIAQKYPILLSINPADAEVIITKKDDTAQIEKEENIYKLEAGEYIITVSKSGYTKSIKDFTISDDVQTHRVEIQLQKIEESPFVFDENTQTIKKYKTKDVPVKLEIPSTINGTAVKHIAADAFKYSSYGGNVNSPLTEVILPEGLETIGKMAFQGSLFTEVTIPSTVKEINGGFRMCKQLKNVNFAPDSQLKVIGEDAFYQTALTEITIPNGVEKIGETAFGSSSLKTTLLPNGIKEIGSSAFSLTAVEEIILPATVEKINYNSRGKQGANGLFFRVFEDETKSQLIFTKVYDKSGNATHENTRGIINPVKVVFKYEDESGRSIESMPTVEAVGINKIKVTQFPKRSSAMETSIGDKTLIKDYKNPYSETEAYSKTEAFSVIASNYFTIGNEWTFEAPEIEGYIKAENITKTLSNKVEEVKFVYRKNNDTFKLEVEGEGITASREGTLPANTEIELSITAPANKTFKRLLINDEEVEVISEGLRQKYSFRLSKDTKVKAEYDNINYDKEIDLQVAKKDLKLGEKTKINLKYRNQDIALTNKDIIIEYNPDILKLEKETGEVTAIGAGTVVLSARLKHSPNTSDSENLNIGPINVKLRVEGVDKTLFAPTDVEIQSLKVKENEDYYKDITFETAVPFLAVKEILKSKNVDTSNQAKFDFSSNGNWMIALDGYNPQALYGQNASFMLAVNNKMANKGAGEFEVKDNDYIVIFTEQNWQKFDAYTFFENEEYTVNVGEDFSTKLFKTPFAMGSGESLETVPSSNALILKDNEPLKNTSGQNITTNENGEFHYTFTEEGTYVLSASKISNGINYISRPYMVVKVIQGSAGVNISSIDEIPGIEVLKGTNKSDLNFPTRVKATLSNGSEKYINLVWGDSQPSYNPDESGRYVFKADYEMPEGVTGEKLEVLCNVIVKEPNENESDIYAWAIRKMNRISDSMREKESIQDWWTIAEIAKLGKTINDSELLSLKIRTFNEKGQVNRDLGNLAKSILALRASGINPEDYYGFNLVEELKTVEHSRGMWDIAPKLWALSVDDFEETDVNDEIEALINEILRRQEDDGLWREWGMWEDSTGFAIYALAPYYSRPNVKVAVEKAVDGISQHILDNGDLIANPGNLNSLVMVGGGLWSANPEYLNDERLVKNGNSILHAIKEYEIENQAGFLWKKDQSDLNPMATEQAFRALVSLYSMKNNKGYVFDYRNTPKRIIEGELTKITGIATLENIHVNYGTTKAEVESKLPKNTKITLSTGAQEEVRLFWKPVTIPEYNAQQPGEYIFTARYSLPKDVYGEKIPVTCKIIVKEQNETTEKNVSALKPLDDITVEFKTSKDELPLPSVATLILSNGEEIDVNLNWNESVPAYNPEQDGEYIFKANYELPQGVSGEKPEISCKVTVLEKPQEEIAKIVEISPVNEISVNLGTGLEDVINALPKTTLIKDSKDKNHSVDLTWSVDNYDANTVGNYIAKAIFNLPERVIQNEPAVDLTVETLVKVIDTVPIIPRTNKDALRKIIADIEIENIISEDYPSDTFEKFAIKLESAKNIENSDDVSQDNVNKVTIELQEAKAKLVKKSDLLKDIIKTAEEKLFIKDQYIGQDIQAVETKLNEAKNKIENSATTEEIDNIKNELADAINNLRLIPYVPPAPTTMTVYFTLKSIERGGNKTQMWIDKTAYTMPLNSRVIDVIDKALRERGIEYINKGNYISTIKSPIDDEWFGEFSNGADSGWMYSVNDQHTRLGVEQYYLSDGDDILWFYTNDYKKEKGSEEWANKSNAGGSAGGVAPNKEIPQVLQQVQTTGQTVTVKEFRDVPKDKWFGEAVYSLVEKGILNGRSEDKFEPDSKVTRAEFLAMLSRIKEENTEEVIKLSDVKEDSWYNGIVNWAIKNDIAKGSENSFRPDASITREEIAVIIMNYLKYNKSISLEKKTTKGNFADNKDIAKWSKEAVEFVQLYGIITGRENNNFAPKANATRAEIAVIIARLLAQ